MFLSWELMPGWRSICTLPYDPAIAIQFLLLIYVPPTLLLVTVQGNEHGQTFGKRQNV